MGKYFGTDGIRGKAFEKLNSKLAFTLGQSLKPVLGAIKLVIGMDTRASSPMLAHLIAAGAMTQGVDVLFAGVVSTPMIAHYAKEKGIVGIMVTASHNPFTDNGIKLFDKGDKMLEDDEAKIEAFLDDPKPKDAPFGRFELGDQVEAMYLSLYEKLRLKPSHQRIGYDSANGANYMISKTVFDRYFPNSHQISNQPDGMNINLNCGSTHVEALIDLIGTHGLDIGFSFDGDGDRIIVVDSDLKVYDGDEILYIIATYLKSKNLLNKDSVVLTKMSNPGIVKALDLKGIQSSRVDVGDKYVSGEMRTHGYVLGGENSGHIIIHDELHTGDGLLVAVYLLKIMTETKKSLQELTKDIVMYPQKMMNLKDVDKN
ncbi:MAG: phosphoglucosamine mutase, partial [Acholeplasmataceae bacterium]|nr:phosphoglucosamine mutase [Acholeplasmataceae bacterium]